MNSATLQGLAVGVERETTRKSRLWHGLSSFLGVVWSGTQAVSCLDLGPSCECECHMLSI